MNDVFLTENRNFRNFKEFHPVSAVQNIVYLFMFTGRDKETKNV